MVDHANLNQTPLLPLSSSSSSGAKFMKDEEEEKREKQLEEDERAKRRDQFRIDNGNGPNQSSLMNIAFAYNSGNYFQVSCFT